MTDVLAESLQKYLTSHFPDAVISDFQFVTSGWESDVYSFVLHRAVEGPQPLILRLYPGAAAVPKLIREAAGLRRLQQAGYPVPAIVLQETGIVALGKPFTLMEKLEGRVLWPVLAEATPPETDALLDCFGHLIARLHQLDWRPFAESIAGYQTDPDVLLDDLFASSQELYARFGLAEMLAVVDWLETNRSTIAVHPAVVHLDFHANNIFLCDDGQWAVIDWTQITVSDYRLDLSWTLLLMGDFGKLYWGERLLSAYQQAVPYPVKNLDYFRVMTYTKLLSDTVISLKAGPQELGMRPETAESIQAQMPILTKVCQRLQGLTGLAFPETETTLDCFS